MTLLVELKDVFKKYGGETSREAAVDGVSFQCQEGRVMALLGPNGAGKSTCIDMIAGLKRPTAGSVTTLGVDPFVSRRVVQAGVGVQPQHADLFENITVQEVFELWTSFYAKAATTREMLQLLNLEPSAKMRVRKLSGGQRQRVLVGLALVSRPRLVVLDEPTSGLDPNAREDLW
ncbi:MAG: ABC transporter ATP-binding protein, partial [Rhodoglobus sp.]